MGSPDWIGVGVMKSGTTWWHRSIMDHPDSVMPATGKECVYPWYEGKQLHFFDQFAAVAPSAEDLAGYGRLFDVPSDKISGEWSPNYFSCFWVPEIIKHFFPESKIIVILRDPVDRFESEISHDLKYSERYGIEIDFRFDIWSVDAFQRGLYFTYLKNWLEVFQNQILVLQYEKCVESFDLEIRRTYEFLGLDPNFVPEDKSNSNPGSGLRSLDSLQEQQLKKFYRPEAELLLDLIDIDLSLWERTFS